MPEELAHHVVVEYLPGLAHAVHTCVVCDATGFEPPTLPCPGPDPAKPLFSVDLVVTNLVTGERTQFKAGRVRYNLDVKPLIDEPLQIGEPRPFYNRMPATVKAYDFTVHGRLLEAEGEIFSVRDHGAVDRPTDEPTGGPVTALGYGRCISCDQMIHVRADGRLRGHGPRARRCPGSGTLPS